MSWRGLLDIKIICVACVKARTGVLAEMAENGVPRCVGEEAVMVRANQHLPVVGATA